MIQNDRSVRDSEGRIILSPLVPLARRDAPPSRDTLTDFLAVDETERYSETP